MGLRAMTPVVGQMGVLGNHQILIPQRMFLRRFGKKANKLGLTWVGTWFCSQGEKGFRDFFPKFVKEGFKKRRWFNSWKGFGRGVY